MNRDYTPEEWARLQAWLDRIYDDFTSKVAARSQARQAEGAWRSPKVASGPAKMPKGIGLVDELGGLHTALALCKQLGQRRRFARCRAQDLSA
jgi:protease-4